MTEAVTAPLQAIADILDSKQELRESLARNPNLAHACLLLRRGEADDVEKALELAEHQQDPDTKVIAECIRVELLRLSGDLAQALERAEALARAERFHPATALCLRNLFPLMVATHPHPEHAVAVEDLQPSPAEESALDSQAVEIQDAPGSSAGDLPAEWAPVVSDPATIHLRLRLPEGVREHRREDLAAGAAEDAAAKGASEILAKFGFGALRHAAFEGTRRSIHTWSDGTRTALAVFATGSSTSLLAARCTKAFQEGSEP